MNRPNQIRTIKPLADDILSQVTASFERTGRRVLESQWHNVDDLSGIFAGMLTVVIIAFHERFGALPPTDVLIQEIAGLSLATRDWDENGIEVSKQGTL